MSYEGFELDEVILKERETKEETAWYTVKRETNKEMTRQEEEKQMYVLYKKRKKELEDAKVPCSEITECTREYNRAVLAVRKRYSEM